MDSVYAQSDIPASVDQAPADVVCRAVDHTVADAQIAAHRHLRHQLVYAVRGLIVVTARHDCWVVPSTRALWMPAGIEHAVRCIGQVWMRSLYIRPEMVPAMPVQPSLVEVGPLLTELIRQAAAIGWDHAQDSRDGRLMRLILDELHVLPDPSLRLPAPRDRRLRRICDALLADPADPSTLGDWAARLQLHAKTVQRLFRCELGMTFGQWRQQVRLLRGLERLADGDKVVDVALALGYDSPSAFTAMFHRQIGCTPSRARAAGRAVGR